MNTGTSIIYSSDEEEDADHKLILRRRSQLLPAEPHDNAIKNSASEPEGLEPQQNLPANDEGSFQSDEVHEENGK